MDAQSPSKRFTRGSMSKSNAMQEIKSKLKNNPIRLEEMSAKSKQSNIKIVEGGKKDQSAAGSSKKRKEKATNYTEENAKRKEVVVSGLLEHDEAVKFLGKREPTRIPHMQCYTNIELVFKNITPTPMELKILELPPEYVQSDSSPTETAAANASDDDFQDPPCPINNKGKKRLILVYRLLRRNQGRQSLLFRTIQHLGSFQSSLI
ncbi:hypothetical protein KY290_000436 [Solanum tuberosum]|uniref:Uncharacterized protein n=1 Tax=Solanum tuberosum TaxID=4113 RepID=A0ABQ7WL91_SOLTU|nr:hypothetical protein KY290_000436 [Solanum tuberosum]